MIIYAPYPYVEDVILMPNPILLNEESTQDVRDYRVSMDKTVHSYVKSTTKRLYVYSFTLTRLKADKFQEFIEKYIHEQWRIFDHHNVEHIGHVVSNPHTTQYAGVYTSNCLEGYSNNERVTFDIEFEA